MRNLISGIILHVLCLVGYKIYEIYEIGKNDKKMLSTEIYRNPSVMIYIFGTHY